MGMYVKEQNQPWNHKQIAGNATGDNALDATSDNNIKNKVVAAKLGNTNISEIGDGTVTGAISQVNSDLSVLSNKENISYNTSVNFAFISNDTSSQDVEILPTAIYLMSYGVNGGGGSRFNGAGFFIVTVDNATLHVVTVKHIGGNITEYEGTVTHKSYNIYTFTNPRGRRMTFWRLGYITL